MKFSVSFCLFLMVSMVLVSSMAHAGATVVGLSEALQ